MSAKYLSVHLSKAEVKLKLVQPQEYDKIRMCCTCTCLFSIVPHKNKRANSGTDGGLAELIHTCVSLHSVTALLIKLVHLMD